LDVPITKHKVRVYFNSDETSNWSVFVIQAIPWNIHDFPSELNLSMARIGSRRQERTKPVETGHISMLLGEPPSLLWIKYPFWLFEPGFRMVKSTCWWETYASVKPRRSYMFVLDFLLLAHPILRQNGGFLKWGNTPKSSIF